MLLLTLALAAAIVRRPAATDPRARSGPPSSWLALLGVAVPWVCGWPSAAACPKTGILTARRLLLVAGGSLIGAAVVGIGALVAGRLGHGPFVPRQDGFLEEPAVSDSPGLVVGRARWLGIPWLLAHRLPDGHPHRRLRHQLRALGRPRQPVLDRVPGRHTRARRLLDLTMSMYRYHDELRATHAASSPWWAWPLDLKPVWYYQQGFADRTTGSIHDTGQPGHLLDGHPGDAVRGPRRVASPEPVADRGGAAVPGHVAAVGTHRPGDLPVPLLHQRAVHRPGAGIPAGRALARPGACSRG